MFKPNLVTHRLGALAWARRGTARAPWTSLLLALALCLGGAGSTPSAQAARAADYSKKIYMLVTKAGSVERTICVGDQVDVRARVLTVVDVIDDPNAEKQFAALYGVPLQASVTDPGVGAILPAASVTSLDTDPVGQARFTFAAKKTGTTTIKVDGKIIKKELLGVALSSDTVSGELSVTVEKCEYRVGLNAVWRIDDRGKDPLIAVITDAALAPDEDGSGKYHGNADVKWYAKIASGLRDCHYVTHPAPSRAFITGERHGSDELEVNMIFESTPALAATLVCPKRSLEQFADHPIIPDSLRFWVRTSGGTVSRHPMLAGAATLEQNATVWVIPVSGH